MKNTLKLGIIAVLIAGIFCTCDVSLGPKLNLDGPIVTILAPAARQPVDGFFFIEGTIKDNTGVDRILVKAKFEGSDFPMQWRYTGRWEVSLDSGRTWSLVPAVTLANGTIVEAQWTGSRTNASWKIPIDMTLAGDIADGQYQFTVTAWNTSGFSDANSLQSRNVMFYKEPPLVDIVAPVLYPKSQLGVSASDLYLMHNLSTWQTPAYLGKLLNQEFTLQWQITEANDVWAIDIRLYEIDIDPATEEDNYIYKMFINDIDAKPAVPSAEQTLRPNGKVIIPDLSLAPHTGTFNGASFEVKQQVSGKTTMQVVVRCMNAAGMELQERMMGCLVYWPDADRPWITFPEALKPTYNPLTDNLYTVFPYTRVPAKAYDDDGVAKVEYAVYSLDSDGEKEQLQYTQAKDDADEDSDNYKSYINTLETKNFSWSFPAPEDIGEFLIEATVFDTNGKSEKFTGYFKTIDASMPEINAPESPNSSEPLYIYIQGDEAEDWNFTITGTASDAMRITSILMVWINPHSANYSAMSQLAYFRDPEYEGWQKAAENATAAVPYEDGEYDRFNPNKVWKLDFDHIGQNDKTNREEYRYNKTLSLKEDLNIFPGEYKTDGTPYEFLRSQVFVFKATGTNEEKNAIIVWSPEGANAAPYIEIKDVKIKKDNSNEPPYSLKLGDIEPIDVFVIDDEIIIEGIWREDSAKYMDIDSVFTRYFDIKISNANIPIDNSSSYATFDIYEDLDADGKRTGQGSWIVTAKVGDPEDRDSPLRTTHLTDTLMINASVTNIGGNTSEDGATWFIETDYVRFLKIGSDKEDGTYTTGETIEFFLEFNKQVSLKNPALTPQLTLNSGGTASYSIKDGLPNTKQYFTYTVGAADSTVGVNDDSLLNISGLVDTSDYTLAGYPYAWTAGSEEIRLITTGTPPTFVPGESHYRVNVLPTSETNLASLMAIKHITIDTTDPNLEKITIGGKGGWIGSGNTIYFSAIFDETVIVETGNEPYLLLNMANDGGPATGKAELVQANEKELIFSCEVQDGDYTPKSGGKYGGSLVITGIVGKITDLAGNEYNNSSFSNITPKDRNDAAVQVKAVKPKAPILQIHNGSAGNATTLVKASGTTPGNSGVAPWDPKNYATSEIFNSTYPNIIPLNNYYFGELWIKITSDETAGEEYTKIQYTVNYGKAWMTFGQAGTSFDNPKERVTPGQYDISAKLVDDAGNESDWTKPISLYWDRGDLLTRISTPPSFGNGTYTNNVLAGGVNPKAEDIPITLTFRRPVKIKSAPKLKINAVRDPEMSDSEIASTSDPYKDKYPSWIAGEMIITQTKWHDTGAAISFPTAAVSEFTFVYTVGPTDNTPYDQFLNVTGLEMDADDENGDSVTALDMINLRLVNDSENPANLKDTKRIKVQTGIPERESEPVFTLGTLNANGTINTSNATNADGTTNAVLEVTFTKDVYRNTATLENPMGGDDIVNEITIIQKKDGFRIPAVLTEAQYNLYKYLLNTEIAKLGETVPANTFVIDAYYGKGTNGYISTGATTGRADTSVKYILDFNVDAYGNKHWKNTDGVYSDDDTTLNDKLEKFVEAFRQAERVRVPINSSSVRLSGNKVTVEFKDSNAMKVLGADYDVKYPAGFVQDFLEAPCKIYPPSDAPGASQTPGYAEGSSDYKNYFGIVTIEGVSRPFIRVSKPQEKIQVRNPVNGTNQPRYYVAAADRAGYAELRMDCRTPDSTVRYTQRDAATGNTNIAGTTAGNFWTYNNSNNINNAPSYSGDPQTPTNAPGAAATPAAANGIATLTNYAVFNDSNFAYDNATPARRIYTKQGTIKVGPAPGTDDLYQGYKLRIRAAGYKAGTTANIIETEEMVYRSVLTFVGSGYSKGTGGATGVSADNGKNFDLAKGDQLWVRGGDTMSGTTIPGYPLTPSDDFNRLGKERAGIRLMSIISGSTLNQAAWQWVTWDINAPAYINLYLGQDETSSAEMVYQYGPKYFSTQKGNWTFAKPFYCMFQGEHRLLNNCYPNIDSGTGATAMGHFTFNATFESRPSVLTVHPSIVNGK